MYAGWDFVLYALLLVAVVLWNFFSKVLRRRGRPPPGVVLPPREVPERIPEVWGRAPTDSLPPDWQAPPAPVALIADRPERERPPPSPARVRARRWRSRAELRRSLVDMTVLGPPRSLEPWNAGGAAGEPSGSRG